MSVLPPGYASVIMPMRRTGDQVPYACTWGIQANLTTYSGEDLATAIGDNFGALWGPSLPTGGQIGPAVVRIGQDGGEPLVYEGSRSVNGTSSSQFTPQNTALLVQKRTALGGRANRGRLFIPCVTEGAVSDVGEIAQATLDIYQGVADEWLSAYTDPEGYDFGPMVVLHRSAQTPTPVTSLRCEPVVATQRRRLRR